MIFATGRLENPLIKAARALKAGPVLLGLALVCAGLLALPGQTITTSYVNDLIVFIDGAHRIAWGQVPNRDFHTALGPLTHYIPAVGYLLSGSFGGAMPIGMALTTLILAPVLAHILATRLRPAIAILFGTFLLLILVTPMNPGEEITSLSFAMFYNRIGWVALGALLVMYLQPRRAQSYQEQLDAVCAAGLTVAMVYTKATYGLVALAFLVFVLFDRSQRRWAAWAIGLTLLAAILVEAVWQATWAHLQDLILTSKVSGLRGPAVLLNSFLRHLTDYVMFAIMVALALWQSRSLRDLLFFGFCAGPGLLLQVQNSQPWGILTLQAGAVVAAEMLLRREGLPLLRLDRRFTSSAGGLLFLVAFLLPTTVQYLLAFGLHSTLAITRSGQVFPLPAFEQVRLARLWVPGDYGLTAPYLATLEDGAKALAALPTPPENVLVLDFANPFSAAFNLPPPRGDYAWLHWGRNIDAEHFLPPERIFKSVDILMQPKWGINHAPLQELYGPYIAAHFEPIRETGSWIIWRRRDVGAGGRFEGRTADSGALASRGQSLALKENTS